MKKFILLASVAFAASVPAQIRSSTFSDRLHKVLPAANVDSIVAHVEAARSRGLPASALENQALMLASKGAPATQIQKAVDARVAGMDRAKSALAAGGRKTASDSEVEAAGDLVRRGVDGSKVSELAKSTPSGRSLAVPLYVIGSLMDRGLPSDSALARVHARLAARASDSTLTKDAKVAGDSISAARKAAGKAKGDAAKGAAGRPALTGPGLAATKRPANAGGGRPATVPANSGTANKPVIPGSQGKGRKR